jgi:hypothetical protein
MALSRRSSVLALKERPRMTISRSPELAMSSSRLWRCRSLLGRRLFDEGEAGAGLAGVMDEGADVLGQAGAAEGIAGTQVIGGDVEPGVLAEQSA